MTFVSDLEPRSLWAHFDTILTIPRGSKQEDQIRAYVIGCADGLGLEHAVDDVGNVVVRKPGTPGRETAPGTVLQSHLDMVNEKNSDVDHDFTRDPIRPVREGDYLTADGTTLGSDNGIGVAAMLALMDASDLEHGPLEFLFTIDEETGLTGAAGLDPSLLTARRLLNLDTEEEGALTVGCAGGADTRVTCGLDVEPLPEGAVAHTVELRGLQGGHSGVDIHLQRGNAVQLLARLIHDIARDEPVALAGIEGGDKHNAIPREARATLVVPAPRWAEVSRRLDVGFEGIQAEYVVPEPDIALRVTETDRPTKVWSRATSLRVLRLIVGLPHGVAVMSHDIDGLVETSTNLAAVKIDDGSVRILMSSRSSVASAMNWIRGKIEAVAALGGCEVVHGNGYPGWKPNLKSPLLEVVSAVHERVTGSAPVVEAVHAGLECGIIGEMVPGMDMISFGPQIEFPHSPAERVDIGSVERFYRLLTETLKELSDG